MALLIDLTADAFKIPANAAVLGFIATANPHAHSNVGTRLIRLGRGIDGARHYCPDFHAFAYVALHNAAHVIFAIAFDMRKIALRLPAEERSAALADGGAVFPPLGESWLCFDMA